MLIIILLVAGCGKRRIMTGGPEVISFRALPFDLSDVRLLEGPFLHAMELNKMILLGYEPDRFLAKFRTEAGLEPEAEHYHGWEDETLAGHSLGHYLGTCALMYGSTGDERFLDRVNYMVDELARIQAVDGDGYMGAFPDGKRILADEVGSGDIHARAFSLNGIWAPFYTQHKIFSGLLYAYRLCDNEKALQISIGLADWLSTVVDDLNDSLVQEMLGCEHGGINESMAELYALTGEDQYLSLSRVFHHRSILDSLADGVDVLPGKHANTQIPKLTGLARRYELTGDGTERETAEFFWNRVVHHHSYVTGGHGNHEYFGQPDQLSKRLSDGTTETCNVYNMLKLSRHLFCWEAGAGTADYYERALFNHILSSQHPGDGRVVYNQSLEMGGYKEYQDPFWFTCCIGTGMESHAKYGWNIYYHNDRELFVSQFIASELDWKEKGLKLQQITHYPEQQGTSFEFGNAAPVACDIMVRYPCWAENGIEILVNGRRRKLKEKPGSFIRIEGEWQSGDMIEVNIPFNLRLESMPDDPHRVAIMYGPLVLAGDLGTEDDTNAYDPMYVPVLLTENRNPDAWMEIVDGSYNTFRTTSVGRPRDVILKPLYRTHERRYTVYWDMYSGEDWSAREQEMRVRREVHEKLQEMTIDRVQLGDSLDEPRHAYQGEKTWTRTFRGRTFREADRSGWFCVDLAVFEGQPMALVVEYWGGFPGSRTFDILLDDEILATENTSNKADGQFILEQYDIPDEMIFDKRIVRVTFQPHEGHRAGPVFTVRTVRR
jgi:DUF1680 family protein